MTPINKAAERSASDQQTPVDQPCYSARLSKAFVNALRRREGFPTHILDKLDKLDIDERITVRYGHKLLQAAIDYTHDPDLGLIAAREVLPGDTGALDYAMSTAATVRESLEIAERYKRLINDTIYFRLQIEGERAMVCLENSLVLPRGALDFQLAVFYRNHFYRWPHTAAVGYEVWFNYSRPEKVIEYKRTFPKIVIRFSAPFTGFVFKKSDLDAPLKTAEPKLHAVIRKHADSILAGLPKASSVSDKVRQVIIADLSGGGPYCQKLAKKLHMSTRTLLRKLENEGISFKELLDDVRRQMALSYLSSRDLAVAEVGFLLGYSQSTAFYRAFKRWTGQTPIEYRRARGR